MNYVASFPYTSMPLFDEHAVAQNCTPSRELQAQHCVLFHAQKTVHFKATFRQEL